MSTGNDTCEEMPAASPDKFFEESLCGFLMTDPEGKIIKGNPRIAEWAGCTREDLPGRKLTDLLNIAGKIYYETHLWPLLRMQGYFDEVVLELQNARGEKMRVMINAKESRDVNDEVCEVYFTVIKATDRLQYEKNLQLQKKNAEQELKHQKELVALREQLIAILGHDLRNPLSAVTMAAVMLPDATDEEERNMILQTLIRGSDRMRELISNIMDFARTRMGEGLQLDLQPAKLEPVLQQVVQELQIAATGHKITSDIHLGEPVICDSNRVAQLVSNLLGNALTHGMADSPVSVQAFRETDSLTISVTNKGNPIPEEMRKQMFAPYTKESVHRSPNGLGLGLYISAEIARAHGGTLNFTSDEEETVFIFTLPL